MSTVIGKRLKLLRQELGLTQDELAEKFNKEFNLTINKSMVSKWENGKGDPYLSYAKYLAIFFGVDLDFLVGLKDEPVPMTIAAHHDDEEWSDAELAEIEEFKKFVKSKRG